MGGGKTSLGTEDESREKNVMIRRGRMMKMRMTERMKGREELHNPC